MQNIKARNLYLPILSKTRFTQTKQTSKSPIENVQKDEINNLLKYIQRKKAQLEKNIENEQSQNSDEGETSSRNVVESSISIGNKYRVPSLQSSQRIINNPDKLREILDQRILREDKMLQKNSQELKGRHFRVRTQTNENPSKSTHHTSKMIKKPLKMITQASKPIIKPLKPAQISKQLSVLIPKIPLKMKQRNEQTLKQIVAFLKDHNPFFMKLDKIVATCLLKVCKIVHFSGREQIYEKETMLNKFFVILSGRVKISNKQIDLRKVCVPGETVLEENWVTWNQEKRVFETKEKARAVGDTYLLEIPLQKIQKVKQQLLKFGFKVQYHELEALVKRNFIFKNSLRTEKNKF